MVLRKMSVLDGHVETFLGIPDQTDEYRKDERKAKAEEKRRETKYTKLFLVSEESGTSLGQIR